MSSFQGRRNWNRGETRGVRIGIEDRGVGGGGGGLECVLVSISFLVLLFPNHMMKLNVIMVAMFPAVIWL